MRRRDPSTLLTIVRLRNASALASRAFSDPRRRAISGGTAPESMMSTRLCVWVDKLPRAAAALILASSFSPVLAKRVTRGGIAPRRTINPFTSAFTERFCRAAAAFFLASWFSLVSNAIKGGSAFTCAMATRFSGSLERLTNVAAMWTWIALSLDCWERATTIFSKMSDFIMACLTSEFRAKWRSAKKTSFLDSMLLTESKDERAGSRPKLSKATRGASCLSVRVMIWRRA
eukprot:Pompholyxophrys_punicea_v1_NODE_505_length_1822_cov_8.882286.p2 type:complete len:231 gc:universal NODE_505_length_1822_cov_8.882286:901-1593(+)